MKPKYIFAVISLLLFSCGDLLTSAVGDGNVSIKIAARSQLNSVYKITVTGSGMQTVGPLEYNGGQTIQIFIPEGNLRKFRFERYTQNRVLTDTGITVVDIGPGMNTIQVNLIAVQQQEKVILIDDFSDTSTGVNALGFYWFYYDDNAGVKPNDRPAKAPNSMPSYIDVPYTLVPRQFEGNVNDTYIIKKYSSLLLLPSGILTAPCLLSWVMNGKQPLIQWNHL